MPTIRKVTLVFAIAVTLIADWTGSASAQPVGIEPMDNPIFPYGIEPMDNPIFPYGIEPMDNPIGR